LTDTKNCNCFITLKWKVKVKPSLRDFCKSPFHFCKPITFIGYHAVHLTFRKIWYCLIKTRIDLVSLSFSNEIYKKNHVHFNVIKQLQSFISVNTWFLLAKALSYVLWYNVILTLHIVNVMLQQPLWMWCLRLIIYNYSLLLRSIRVFMDLKNDIHRRKMDKDITSFS
jgi:hypothetical protein